MAGDFLIDTNIVVALFKHDEDVLKRIQLESVFLPVVALGELYYGAFASNQREKNLARLEEFANDVAMLSVNRVTANVYGKIKSQLRSIGRPIPDNDVWIAATAMQHGLTLSTRDDHFRFIDGLVVARW